MLYKAELLGASQGTASYPERLTPREAGMVQTITLKKIGGSVAAIIPKDLLQRKNLDANDEVFVVETPDGILLTAADPATTAAMAAYAEGAKENRVALAALAKL